VKAVERSRFLELVAVIAGRSRGPGCVSDGPSIGAWVSVAAASTAAAVVACGAHGSDVAGAEVRIPVQPAAPPRSAAPRSLPSASAVATDDPGAPSEEGNEPDDPDELASCGEVDSRQVTRPSGACTDTTPAPGACAGCGTKGFGSSKCASYRQYLKPKVAKAATDCLAKLAAPRCDSCAIYACGDRAMKASCPDASADTECRALAKTCPRMPMDDCSRYMAALLPAGRSKLKSCMTRCSLFSCVEGL
jgi:hypothetical protein